MGAKKENEALGLCTHALTYFPAIVYRARWRKKVDMFNSRYFSSPTLRVMDLRSMVNLAAGSTAPVNDLQPKRQFVAPVGFLLAKMLAECRQMDRQRVQKRRNQNYRRLPGVAKLDAGLASAVRVKSYTHVLGVIWVGVGSANHCIGGNDR